MGTPTHKERRKLAIFDIDGTVFRSSLLIEVFNALVKDRVLPKSAGTQVERHYTRWLDRKGHYDDYLMTMVRVYYKQLKGKRATDVERVIKRVVDRNQDRVYRYTRDLIADLKKKNYLVLAISNSQESTVRLFAEAAGFNGAIGRTLEVIDGRFTGWGLVDGKRFPVDVKLDKPKLLKDFCTGRGIIADMKNSVAIGDSEGDLAILSIVGNPIAFNPSYELARIAKRRNWKIVVERKDIMYHIKDAHLKVSRERPSERAKF